MPLESFCTTQYRGYFSSRYNLNAQHLIELFNWPELEFLTNTEGSAIRRIGG